MEEKKNLLPTISIGESHIDLARNLKRAFTLLSFFLGDHFFRLRLNSKEIAKEAASQKEHSSDAAASQKTLVTKLVIQIGKNLSEKPMKLIGRDLWPSLDSLGSSQKITLCATSFVVQSR